MVEGEKTLNTENIIEGTDKCRLEGINGRAKTCPNNPVRSPDQSVRKICDECLTNPKIASSTGDKLPDAYKEIRSGKYLRKTP